ncbi:MAG: TetR family transcriptional regulator [Acidimicrobiia bacterium]|nr:TetR family transcriptional regulator [Acidimicrobiia bacterium]
MDPAVRGKSATPSVGPDVGRQLVGHRRQEILAAATRIFAEKGISNTTVRDIADEVGILSGSLYHHFESKEQIVEEVLVRSGGERQHARYREIAETIDDPTEAFAEIIRLGVASVARSPDRARIMRNDAHLFRSLPRLRFVEKMRQDNLDLWMSVVRRGQERGVFRDELDPDVICRAVSDAVLSTFRWFSPTERVAPERVGAQLVMFYLEGLRRP